MGDLIAAAKKGQGAVSYGSWGVGSPGHLGGEWLDLVDGTQMTHVPFREVSQLFTSVANGDPAWSLASIPSSQGIYKAGKIRYLAVAGPRRIAQLPDVPTLAEAGGPAQVDVNSFVSLLAVKGVPAPVLTSATPPSTRTVPGSAAARESSAAASTFRRLARQVVHAPPTRTTRSRWAASRNR